MYNSENVIGEDGLTIGDFTGKSLVSIDLPSSRGNRNQVVRVEVEGGAFIDLETSPFEIIEISGELSSVGRTKRKREIAARLLLEADHLASEEVPE